MVVTLGATVMVYTYPRKALMAELSADVIFVVLIIVLALPHALTPATSQADKAHQHSSQEFHAPLLL